MCSNLDAYSCHVQLAYAYAGECLRFLPQAEGGKKEVTQRARKNQALP